MLEEAKGDANIAEYIREVLKEHLEGATEHQRGAGEHLDGADGVGALLALYKEELNHIKVENLRLLELLAREQALHLTTQQKLVESKPWWQFWKK